MCPMTGGIPFYVFGLIKSRLTICCFNSKVKKLDQSDQSCVMHASSGITLASIGCAGSGSGQKWGWCLRSQPGVSPLAESKFSASFLWTNVTFRAKMFLFPQVCVWQKTQCLWSRLLSAELRNEKFLSKRTRKNPLFVRSETGALLVLLFTHRKCFLR